jgi:hypothetical protein
MMLFDTHTENLSNGSSIHLFSILFQNVLDIEACSR